MPLEQKKTKYPLLRVKLDNIRKNAGSLVAECARHGVNLWGVSKGISAFPEVARAFASGGIKIIADSRLDNIRRMREAGVALEYALIRIPMRSELEELAELCDYTLISDIGTLEALAEICEKSGREVKCVVMFDMGDLREGFWFKEAELVEVRTKPTLPVGEIGHDAFGSVPVFEDRGDRRRGILALGKQDVNISGLEPLDDGVRIITASSDHLLVDIEERPDLKVGDVLSFRPDYTAMLSSSTSPYVTKVFE